MTDELFRLSAVDAVAQLRSGDLTPLDLIDAAEQRTGQVNQAVNALVTPCFDRAREHARRLMAQPAAQRGMLAGLPLAIKDLNDVAGVRTTYGSPIFADNVPQVSDIMVQMLEGHGGVVVGMTNSPEFGAGANTFNEVYGETLNPWNPALNAGGSSGGSAAALAVGIVALATGSDLGGSLRTPAGYCSVVGLRPSPGRVASGPAEQRFQDLSVEGPMARNVADVALMLDAMVGYRVEDPTSLPAPGEPFLNAALKRKRPKRVAVAADLGGVSPVDQQTRAIIRQTADKLSDAGIEVVEATPDFHGAMDAFYTLRALGYATNMRALLSKHRDKLKPDVIWNIEQGMALTADKIGKAQLRRSRLYGDVVTFLDQHDLILAPSACCVPGPIGERWVRKVDGHEFNDYIGWLTIHGVITLTSCPALAIPAGFSADGRPVGVQLVGRHRGEADLLSAGAAIEEILGVAGQVPIDPKPARSL
jgi:amidase